MGASSTPQCGCRRRFTDTIGAWVFGGGSRSLGWQTEEYFPPLRAQRATLPGTAGHPGLWRVVGRFSLPAGRGTPDEQPQAPGLEMVGATHRSCEFCDWRLLSACFARSLWRNSGVVPGLKESSPRPLVESCPPLLRFLLLITGGYLRPDPVNWVMGRNLCPSQVVAAM